VLALQKAQESAANNDSSRADRYEYVGDGSGDVFKSRSVRIND
jgi:hypothetical protein